MPQESIWTTVTYGPGGEKIAHGLARIMQILPDKTQSQDFFHQKDVYWGVVHNSDTTTVDPRFGPVRYWNIVVPGQPILKDAAWAFTNPPADCEIHDLKDRVVFKEKTKPVFIGDGVYESGEAEGLHIDEHWDA